MNLVNILFDPVPVARIGHDKKKQQLVFTKDYSCYQLLLEEYIAHGAVSIVIPSSSPESLTMGGMSPLLQRRIKIIDDQKEEEAVERIFHGIFQELGVTFNPLSRNYFLPLSLTDEIAEAVENAHANTKRLLFAYNHRLQTEINIELASKAYRLVRECVKHPASRLVMAQLEGLLKHYEPTTFVACLPKGEKQVELINAFDQLANDGDYLSYSLEISSLSDPRCRDSALFKLRSLSKRISGKECVGVAWDYVTKILNVFTGIPFPESRELAYFTNEKPLPTFISMQGARERAVHNWIKAGNTGCPLKRSGKPYASSDGPIDWLPPIPMKLSRPNDAEYCFAENLDKFVDVINKHIESLGTEPSSSSDKTQ